MGLKNCGGGQMGTCFKTCKVKQCQKKKKTKKK